jgi:hypothetical protein
MDISIDGRRRPEADAEAWERAHPLPPRPYSRPDLLHRKRRWIGAGIKYVWWAVEIIAITCVVVVFVLPYTLTALAVAGGARLVMRFLRD